MLTNKIKTILVILLIYFEENQASRITKFRSGNSTFSPKYFSNFTLTTANDTLFLDMFVVKPLVSGFKANLEFLLRIDNSKSFQRIFAYTLDVCSVVISLKESFFKKWFKSLLKHGNFMENCPVDPGHYYLNGWTMDPAMIPSYLFPGEYRLRGYGFMGKFKTKSEEFVVQVEMDMIVLAN